MVRGERGEVSRGEVSRGEGRGERGDMMIFFL